MKIYDSLRNTKAFTFLAIQGAENNRDVFTFNLTYADFIECFSAVPYDPNSDLLLQRETQKSRINDIFQYTQVDYAALPSCGAILEDFTLEKTTLPNIVMLTLPANAFRYLFDGQGRLAGINKLMKTTSDYAQNTITIKGYKTQGVTLDNQLFADFNGASVTPNKSICQSMDSRKLVNTFTKDILKGNDMQVINSRIDYTKASVTQSQSPKLWSLNQFNTVIQTILGVTAKSAETLLSDAEKRQFWSGFICKYFQALINVPAINQAVSSDEGAQFSKEHTIIGTAVWLKGIAVTGRALAMHLMQVTEPNTRVDWSFMDGLNSVDFSKNNPEWIGRCMDFRGRFQDKGFNHKAMAAYLLTALNIELPEELEVIEDEVLIVKSEQRKAEREAKQASKLAELEQA